MCCSFCALISPVVRFLCRQFENEANAKFHYDTTGQESFGNFEIHCPFSFRKSDPCKCSISRDDFGQEILNDFEGMKLDYFVLGYGTGGTFSGAGKALKEKRKDLKVCLGEPADAPLVASGTKSERNADGSATGSHPAFKPHPIQGWTPDFIPLITENGIANTGYDEFVPIPGDAAIEMSQQLAKTQGIFTGISGGASMYAAVEMAKKAPEGSVLVAILADTGERYLSTPLFAAISADMNAEEVEISKSTPNFQL